MPSPSSWQGDVKSLPHKIITLEDVGRLVLSFPLAMALRITYFYRIYITRYGSLRIVSLGVISK